MVSCDINTQMLPSLYKIFRIIGLQVQPFIEKLVPLLGPVLFFLGKDKFFIQ